MQGKGYSVTTFSASNFKYDDAIIYFQHKSTNKRVFYITFNVLLGYIETADFRSRSVASDTNHYTMAT